MGPPTVSPVGECPHTCLSTQYLLEWLVPGEAYWVPFFQFWRLGAAEKLRAYS